uniref:Small ribosomal subunit protein eS4 central region domain-containing protein n=1 Tax=Zea mays TaxID=4577 RepID=A0A804NPY4_MAIZE
MANGVDSLSRDLANISIAPGAPTAAPASTLLVPPPPAWEVPAPHAIEGAIPATPDLPLVGQEEQLKLCKVRSVQFGQKGIPYLNTYNGRTIRYPDPLIKANDTIKIDLENNKIMDFFKFDIGNVVMVTGGRNTRKT